MSNILVGELQDYEGNTIYPHTEATVVFMSDGMPLSEFSKDDITDEQIEKILMKQEG